LFTENTHTHTHTHSSKTEEISAVVTGISEHTLARVVQTKDNYRYLWMLTISSEKWQYLTSVETVRLNNIMFVMYVGERTKTSFWNNPVFISP